MAHQLMIRDGANLNGLDLTTEFTFGPITVEFSMYTPVDKDEYWCGEFRLDKTKVKNEGD